MESNKIGPQVIRESGNLIHVIDRVSGSCFSFIFCHILLTTVNQT